MSEVALGAVGQAALVATALHKATRAPAVLIALFLVGRAATVQASPPSSPAPRGARERTSPIPPAPAADPGFAAPQIDSRVVQIDGGTGFCAVTADGRVRCWGFLLGPAGDGAEPPQPRGVFPPVEARLPAPAVEVALSNASACARLANGETWCWGDNSRGQLGDGTTIAQRLLPVRVPGLANVAQLAMGEMFACARRRDGRVVCWGSNLYGQIGDGRRSPELGDEDVRRKPVLVPGLTDVVEVACGQYHACARRKDGSVLCWGMNNPAHIEGVAGVPEFRLAVPTPVAGLRPAVQLALGQHQSCALHADGTVSCWGAVLHSWEFRKGGHPPSPVPGLTDVVSIAGSAFHACAVSRTGTLRCWGSNENGRLGDGTQTDHALPVEVRGLPAVQQVALGFLGSCAVTTEGDVYCWGIIMPGDANAEWHRPMRVQF